MNKLSKHALSCVLGSLVIASPVMAADDANEKNWTAEAELGFLRTAGNSDTETVNAKFNGTKSYSAFKHTLNLEALNSSQDDVRSAEKYSAKLQSDYNLSDDRSYLLGAIDWEKDLFSSFDYKAAAVIGYGYKVIKEDEKTLDIELSPGYRISEQDPGETEKEAIVRFGEKFTWKISESADFDQYLSVDWGDSNTVTKFGASIASKISTKFRLKVGYALTHNSDVTGDTSNTDTETSVTLAYSFH